MSKTNILTMNDSEFEVWCSSMGMAPLPSIDAVENLLTLYCQALGANTADKRGQCLQELTNLWRVMANDTQSAPLLDGVIPGLPWCTRQNWLL
jgi:hypothetical protein